MKLPRSFPGFVIAVCLLLCPPLAQALMVDLIFRDAGERISGGGFAGTAPSSAQGGGNLMALMERAAAYWESVILDDYTLTLEYGWASISSSNSAEHTLLAEGGTPWRESYGTVAFDNDGSTDWFLDPTPLDNSEYTTFTNYTQYLGGGTINTGRVFTGGKGAAANFDLLSSAMHEIGHSLGLSKSNDAYVAEAGTDFSVAVKAPRPFPGSGIGVNDGHLTLENALMKASRPEGVRRYASMADILADAQISGFTDLNLSPQIPEPAVSGMLLLGGAAWALGRNRRRSGREDGAKSVSP